MISGMTVKCCETCKHCKNAREIGEYECEGVIGNLVVLEDFLPTGDYFACEGDSWKEKE
ncbi:hypothetical protein OCV51_07610 [Faecalicatena acetigenes]|uniref:Uncharacterized protein n=1 Tax=Faecalicatena acetigenes TaxID=2981790 RepID=A0ABT2TCH1_9FIRM|nr:MULTISPECIES: hypothetical protein [Lachnospiraceae]MCU6747521.1 hypothetical protein [Faecalicatena acetigenes]SCH93631.1 Uncharacterised protein [uncultured Clostridium sp.]